MTWDLVKLVDRLKQDSVEFWLSPRQWRKFRSPASLCWVSVPFCRADAKNVPKIRGVYAFIITASKNGIPPHGYVTYIGETGQNSRETLRSRFVSYFSEMKEQSRPVHYVLNKYQQHLRFHFSEVPDKRCNLKHIETNLCDALENPRGLVVYCYVDAAADQQTVLLDTKKLLKAAVKENDAEAVPIIRG